MTSRQKKIRIELFAPASEALPETDSCAHADEAVLRLARLIGRQMAREQFERTRSKARRGARK